MTIRNGAEQAGDLIGQSLDRLFNRSRHATVLRVSKPSDEDEAWFNAMVQNGTIYSQDVGGKPMLMIRVDQNVSTGFNLNTGAYAFGLKKVEPGILFLARRLAGWKDPTGARRRKVK